jgi:hypothetical protein
MEYKMAETFEAEKQRLRTAYKTQAEQFEGPDPIAFEVFYGASTPVDYAIVLKNGRYQDFTQRKQGVIEEGSTIHIHNLSITKKDGIIVSKMSGISILAKEIVSLDTIVVKEFNM